MRKVTSAPRMGSWVETIHTKKGYKPQKAVNVTNNVTKRDQQRDQVYMFDLFIFIFEEINMLVDLNKFTLNCVEEIDMLVVIVDWNNSSSGHILSN